jgi:tetratricopeptide (TPR) repeat protein
VWPPPRSTANVQSRVFRATLKLLFSVFCFREPEMPHVTKEELLRASEAGGAEIARTASHVSICPSCRALAASLLRDRANPGAREVPLKTLLELAAFEREMAVEQLLARAEFAELRRLTKGSQKERVIRSRSCHTPVFLSVLLATLRASPQREEAEFLTSLAVLAAQGMDAKDGTAFRNDVLATIWTEMANVRRIHSEWHHAEAALARAEQHLGTGTGNPSLKARWLSVSGSLRSDQGARDEAMACLEECRKIYEERKDWPLVARTLVQMANCLADHDPARGLVLLDRASVFLPSEDAALRWLAVSIRSECLITLGRGDEALRVFGEAELLRPLHQWPSAKLRSTFTSARLLEAHGRAQEAEALFEEAVTGDMEQGFYKDALLDLLYAFGFHVRLGSPERAADLSLRTLGEMERESSVVHEQLRLVWTQLIDAARSEALDDRMLAEAHAYLQAYWKHPAPAEPVLLRQEPAPSSSRRVAVVEDEKLIEPVLARARWSLVRRETRKRQHTHVAESPECHTRGFFEVLLTDMGATGPREDSEFIASLALTAVQAMDEPATLKHDLQAQVWTEIANASRIDIEWNRALAALRRAEEHRFQGTGNLLLKGKIQSVAASLKADQGYRSEAIAMLEECRKLYEDQKVWPLVARTLVQMAHTLVDTEPERGLALAEQALPMIPPADSVLRWLAESNRTECLIEMGEIGQALQAFHLAESMRAARPRSDAARLSDFTAARLLEGLGRIKEAEQLFGAVIADAFAHEAYREACLDLLYLFGLHVRTGATEKAVALCRFAIAQLDLYGVGNEQLRAVWMELMDAATRQAISLEALAEAREFLKIHWKKPAAKVPRFSFRPRAS